MDYHSIDVKNVAGPLISSMIDKSQEVRSLTEELIKRIVAIHGTF
jgi:hypothetical protein